MKLRGILITFSLLAFLSASAAGYLYYHSLRELALKEADRQASHHSEMARSYVSSYLAQNLKPVRTLAGLPELRESLEDQADESTAKATLSLEHFCKTLEADVCYLIDAQGDTVASSNHADSDSFVGKNYSFRPYFRQAMQGVAGIYMAKGITSTKRGIYYSHPVYGEKRGGLPIGAVVIKAPVETLERALVRTNGGIILLVDPNGIIFISNRNDWLFHSVGRLTPGQTRRIAETQQFGEGPFEWIGLEVQRDEALAVDQSGNRYLIHRMQVDEQRDWKIIYLSDFGGLYQGVSGPLGRIAGYIVLVFCGFIGLLVIFLNRRAEQEIARQKAIEEALREGEEKFSKVFSASPDGITISSLEEGRFIDANEAFLKATGYSREDVIGRTSCELAIWDNPRDRASLIERLDGCGNVRNMEFKIRSKSGEVRTILSSAEEIELGGQSYLLIISRDIGERKRLEEQLQQGQRLKSIGVLAGGVAHDFNNLLQIIQGFAELLFQAKTKEDPEYRKLEAIIKATQRGSELTRQMLTFSRHLETKRRHSDLNHAVEEVARLIEHIIPKKIEVKLQLASDLKLVDADPTQMEQIVMNLVLNAKDAMPEGGRIIIETRNVQLDEEHCRIYPLALPGEHVLLTVSDAGCGMDQETADCIFEPFYSTKGPGSGVGLGLSIVYGIVQSHQGHLLCYSQPGMGTTFRIYLPAIGSLENQPFINAVKSSASV
jgi:PAS domain S-box-containing protein